MNGIKVKVVMNAQKVKQYSKAQVQAANMTAEQMRTEIIEEQVIPFDEGTLQNVQTYVDISGTKQGIVSIVHDTPYASQLYFHPEYNFQQTFNQNAKGEWWYEWLEGAKSSRPAKLFKQFYRKLIGG